MLTVFAAFYGEYDTNHPIGVYDTLLRAKQAVEESNPAYDTEVIKYDVSTGMLSCCGMGGLTNLKYLPYVEKEELDEIYLFLKKRFGPTSKRDGRISTYPYNQLFYTHADGWMEKYPAIMEALHVKKEMTWQSASEPGHLTALYSINFV